RECSVAREISKLHETHHRGTLQELANYFNANEPKGEIVIIVAGAPQTPRGEHVNKYREQ
ncbi:MAG: 16S rRNA (cytidine(1402)-2'-O)-methyltransferase, partial [Bacteroidales bacterium]|nr:16S rRNA (cytidine(1402)-2'-O)-methyltransferase [Bacteroidales bacterium]